MKYINHKALLEQLRYWEVQKSQSNDIIFISECENKISELVRKLEEIGIKYERGEK